MEVDTAKFASGLSRSQSMLGGFTRKLAGIGIGLGIAGLGKEAIGAAVDMETAMAGLAKATDLPAPALANLKQGLYGLSTTLKGVKLDDLISIATEGGKLGIAADQLLPYTEGIAKLSIALDDIPAGELANQIGKLNSVFKLGVPGSMQLGSAIDKVADSGVSSAADILNLTQRISGTAVVAKISAQESIALAGALLDTGTQAELGASAINKLIMATVKTKNASKFASAMGISTEEFAAQMKDKPIKAISGFLTALKGMDAASQLKTLEGIGFKGATGAAEIQKLSQQAGSLATYVGYANSEFQTLNQITSSYNTNAATTKALWIQSQNRLQILSEQIGTALLPAVNVGLGLMGDLTAGIGNSFVASQGIITQWSADNSASLSGWGVSVGTILENIGYGFRNLPDFMGIAGIKMMEFGMNFMAVINTIPQNLGIIGEYISNNWYQLLLDGVNAVLALFDNLGKNIYNLTNAILDFFNDPTKGVQFNYTPLMEGFKAYSAELPKLLAPDLVSFQDQIDQKLGEIKDRESARGVAKEALAGGPSALKEILPDIPGLPTGDEALIGKKKQHAGAVELGSAEARTAILDFQTGKAGQDEQKQQVNLQKTMVKHLGLLAKIAGQSNVFGDNEKPVI